MTQQMRKNIYGDTGRTSTQQGESYHVASKTMRLASQGAGKQGSSTEKDKVNRNVTMTELVNKEGRILYVPEGRATTEHVR